MRDNGVISPTPRSEHRTRVGQERRHRTRDQLVRAAFQVIDEEGMERFSVERVRLTAGLSRGSFYFHFCTAAGLLAHVSHLIWTQVRAEQAAFAADIGDPLDRLCFCLRHGVDRSASDPACGRVLLRTLQTSGTVSDEIRTRMLSAISAALQQGDVSVPSTATAVDLVLAMVVEMLRTGIVLGPDAARLDEQMIIVLQALGISKDRVTGLAVRNRPTPVVTSLRDKILAAS